VDHRPDRSLSRDDLDADPIAQFVAWLTAAKDAGVRLADAMAVATADASGAPSVRHVLLRGIDERGFVFFTNRGSRKARQLAENPRGALTFLWKELDRQVNVSGAVSRIADAESEAYFRTRPREARIGAWASRQSEVLGSREELQRRFDELSERYPGDDVPLPPFWGGFRLDPDVVEFWQGRAFRLHDRFRYTRGPEGSWRIDRLFP
jgi:pyridoxamine 5'-phosphate oxidase